MTAIKVREASMSDVYDIVHISKRFYKEGRYTFLEYDPECVRKQIEFHINNPDAKIWLSLNEEDDVTGMLAATVGVHFFANQKVANEIVWFVLSEHRSTSSGPRLFKEYQNWAKEEGCAMLNFSRIHGVGDEEKLDKFYKSKGLRLIEHTYIKELEL